MEAVKHDKQVSVIQKSIDIFRSAPEVLKANQDRTMKAVTVGNAILDQWEAAWAITDEEKKMQALLAADERSNKYLVNCAAALTQEKDARAAITQMMDEFKKMFTAAEAELDKSKAGTVTAKVQANRDATAREIAKIQERKRQEAERVAAKAKEAVDIRFEMEEGLTRQFGDFLLKAKQWLQGQFNALTFTKFADDAAQIRLYEPLYKEEAFAKLHVYATNPKHHTDEELATIHAEVKQSLFTRFSDRYTAEMGELKREIVDQIPSKFAELQEQKRLSIEAEERRQAELKAQAEAEAKRQEELRKSEADAEQRRMILAKQQEEREAEQAKLRAIEEENARQKAAAESEQRRREDEEKARMDREAEEARAREAADAEARKSAAQTLVMFEQEAAVSTPTDAPAARQGFEIVVLHPVGYMRIFALWFEKEGKNLPTDKIGNTKLDQMKAWCEKHAHKTGEKIEDKFLRYEETYKAVNKK